jgi:16S rRNA C967 or C1407 C5-methylase (RsmB/RsmF family)/NOL1/NOP2/fmu family ribosome biogenesis protein
MKNKNRFDRFYQRIEKQIGSAEARQLLDALQPRAPKSVRYHSRRCEPGELKGAPVPWCQPYGRYWEEEIPPSHTIAYAAGKYYIQEASAMLAISAAAAVIDFSDKIVLDLTAAPGGKTTQAAELISTGYLVANEVIPKRVKALTWNINRHRLNNVIITSLATNFLALALPGFFDIVMVDAPCSGEGLFQKRKHSVSAWSEKNVRFCARRQTSILNDAMTLVRPGGAIVYSTCTFSAEENEKQVEFLLQQGFLPVPLPVDLPVSPAVTGNEKIGLCSRRIFPHREKGAGAFVGVVQKKTGPLEPFPGKYDSFKSRELELKAGPAHFIRAKELEGYFYESGGVTSYFSYERIPAILREKSIQLGAPVLDKRRAEVFMFGCGQITAAEAMIELEPWQAEMYIKGENLDLGYPDGAYFVTFQGMLLGPVKITKKEAVNQFPQPLRKQ